MDAPFKLLQRHQVKKRRSDLVKVMWFVLSYVLLLFLLTKTIHVEDFDECVQVSQDNYLHWIHFSNFNRIKDSGNFEVFSLWSVAVFVAESHPGGRLMEMRERRKISPVNTILKLLQGSYVNKTWQDFLKVSVVPLLPLLKAYEPRYLQRMLLKLS